MKCNSDDTDGITDNIEGKRKPLTWEVYRKTMNDRKSALLSALLEECKCEVFEHSLASKHKTRSAGLAERLGGEFFRRRHTKAGATIIKVI